MFECRVMFACRRMRGLIAGSLYGELSERERGVLEGHLKGCARCRAEAESLEKLVLAMPDAPPELDRNLLPALRAELRVAQRTPGLLRRQWAWAGAAVAVVAIAFAYGVLGPASRRPEGEGAPQPLTAAVPGSAVARALDQAATLEEERDYVGAYRVLAEAVEAAPDDALSGEAQLACADIAFGQLQWYPEAFDAYETLATAYPQVFTQSAVSVNRRDLLTEAREQDYAPLYALDAARRNVAAPFEQYEQVIARYAGTFSASIAAREMVALVKQETSPADGPQWSVASMERVRDRCTDPIAITQLDFELGRYWQEQNEPERARDQYNKVVDSGAGALVRLARDSLTLLDNNAAR